MKPKREKKHKVNKGGFEKRSSHQSIPAFISKSM